MTGEGWTGDGCGWALSDSTIPNAIRAVQSTILFHLALEQRGGQIVAVLDAAFADVAGRHTIAAVIEDASSQ